MHSIRGVLLCGAAIAAVAPIGGSAAGAAPPWSAPTIVSRPANFLDSSFIGFGGDGRALLAWSFQNGIGDDARAGWRMASRAPDGTVDPERRAPNLFTPPVVYGRDRVVVVRMDQRTVDRIRLRVGFGSTTARFGRPPTVDTAELTAGPALAANDRGRVALAYGQRRPFGGRVATLVERRPGRGFAGPRILDGSVGAMDVAVAVGGRGDLVVAWERRRSRHRDPQIHARVRPAGGRLGPVVRLARSPRLPDALRVAVTPRGAVWVAWAATREFEVGFDTPYQIRFAMRPAGARRFRPARQLDGNARVAEAAGMDLAVDPDGTAFVAWSGWDGANLRARLATVSTDGRSIARRTLSQPGYDAAIEQVITSRRPGEALVAWERLDAPREIGTQVLAGLVEPGGRYAGEEMVSDADRAQQPWADFDPVTGAPTIVWSQRIGPDAPFVPVDQLQTVARTATRQG
jgi:hypothetical protein